MNVRTQKMCGGAFSSLVAFFFLTLIFRDGHRFHQILSYIHIFKEKKKQFRKFGVIGNRKTEFNFLKLHVLLAQNIWF